MTELNYDELKKMQGQPVYIENHVCFANFEGWALVKSFDDFPYESVCFLTVEGEYWVPFSYIGKSAKVYRNQP